MAIFSELKIADFPGLCVASLKPTTSFSMFNKFESQCKVNRIELHPWDVWLDLIVVRTSIIQPFKTFLARIKH